jgi:uncharacterized membrane protein YgcG
MIKSAYSEQWINNLQIIKQAKRWLKSGMIGQDQFNAISESYKVPLFHPNLAIRILLFIATLFAASGASGVIILMFSGAGEIAISIISILFAVASFVILENVFINKNHYKSGVTEGIAYMACGFMIGGIGGLFDFDNITLIQLACLLVFSFAAFRYTDLILTLAFMFTFSWILFYHCYEAGGVFKNIIPFVFMIVFSGFYFLTQKYKRRDDLKLWFDNLLVLEVCSLILIYAGGNYLVVRELSVNMMDLVLEPGEDIPFAWLFMFFTIAIPLGYLWAGIINKNSVLIRVGLVTFAFSVYTWKYYFLPDYTEIFLMVAGGILIIAGVILIRSLKAVRKGFTSETLLTSAWADLNVEAFIISQTMGGNQPEKTSITETGGGGDSGGGGASSSF